MPAGAGFIRVGAVCASRGRLKIRERIDRGVRSQGKILSEQVRWGCEPRPVKDTRGA